jgi:hypothetical protein
MHVYQELTGKQLNNGRRLCANRVCADMGCRFCSMKCYKQNVKKKKTAADPWDCSGADGHHNCKNLDARGRNIHDPQYSPPSGKSSVRCVSE